MNTFNRLNTLDVTADVPVQANPLLSTAEESGLDRLSVSAQKYMHNLDDQNAVYLDPDTSVDDATLVLNKTHVASMFVAQDGVLLGIISQARLGSRHILKEAQLRGCQRSDLVASDVMLPLKTLKQISLTDLRTARSGDVLVTMEAHGLDYLLVTAPETGRICGYFDLVELIKVGGRSVNQLRPAEHFNDIVVSVLHHSER
ncbi:MULTISPECIES: CBS domain-containing protein [unclassified Pseudoalteromonas]|uniref:CBS domain-containing protein n=1 Tax=unclassified Pseudoalteromonas TaxID=194690 RepID=UPI002097FC2B|nr:CBS domain-containing protein [Pseudoalteromonas sp. XMcav2-N]MCO7188335.1 CBS domain-containing protein [Pseudoalteromonas sp. XMcav2-N]